MGIRETLRPTREQLAAVAVSNRLTGVGRFFVPVAKTATPVLRADDLVVLSISWSGVELAVVDGVAVLRDADGRGGILVAHFPPQHVDEEAFWDEGPELGQVMPPDPAAAAKSAAADPGRDTVAESRLAAASRLAFDIPAGWGPITYTVAGILEALGRLPLRVHPGALPRRAAPSGRGPLLGGILGQLGRTLRHPHVELERQPVFRGIGPDPGPRALAQTVGRRLLDAQRLVSDVPASQRLLTRQRVQTFAVHSALTGAAGAIERPGLEFVELRPGIADLLLRTLRAPTELETAIELPTKLVLSPHAAAGFAHETTARTLGPAARSELWHTRLGARVAGAPGEPASIHVDEHAAQGRTVRAVWARSGLPPGFPTPFGRIGEPDVEPRPDPESAPPLHTLDALDRWSLVHLTADYGQTVGRRRYEPDPVDVDGLMLSALGGWLDSRGAWPNGPSGISLSEWRHRATLGRDHFVRVVYEGVLLPWGHRAALVKVSERRFHNDVEGNPAFLRQRMFIVVRQPHLAYTAPGLKNAAGELWEHALPFGALRIRTTVTPPLQFPGSGIDGRGRTLFVPRVASAAFRFAMRAETLDGGRVDFTAPAVFAAFEQAPGDSATLPETAARVEAAIAALGSDLEVDLHGQRVPLAAPGAAGDTILPVHVIGFGAQVPDDPTYAAYAAVADRLPGDSKPVPRCFPRMVRTQVELPVAKHFAGGDGRPWMVPARSYLRTQAGGGFGAGNDGQVFLLSQGPPTGMDFTTRGATTGGLIQPSFAIQGISRIMGPVSGTGQLDTLAGGQFEPEDFFGDGFDPLLFGVIPLTTIVQGAGIGDAGAIPKFVTELATALEGFVAAMDRAEAAGGAVAAAIANVRGALDTLIGGATEAARAAAETAVRDAIADLQAKLAAAAAGAAAPALDALRTLVADAQKVNALLAALRVRDELTLRFDWNPALKDASVFLARDDHAAATLVVSVEGKVKTSGAAPTFDVAAKLDHFTLDLVHGLASFLEIQFDRLHFLAPAGRKPDIVCDIGRVEFVGVLSFVEALKSLIPLDGFSDPPALTVSAEGVKADYSLALPDIAFGVFALQNLSLSAGFTVPFVANPLTVRFSFCERHAPFLLTVSAFGGGGFVSICVDPDGVQALEAGFEFGASLAMNFGVASGEVHVLGGFVYAMIADEASLTGYLRIGGSVEALGIVTVSIELALELHYEFASGKCVGKATLTIEVDIAFFSVSVEISCERRFAGSNGDPPLAWVMGPTAELPAPAPDEPDGTFPWIEYRRAFA